MFQFVRRSAPPKPGREVQQRILEIAKPVAGGGYELSWFLGFGVVEVVRRL